MRSDSSQSAILTRQDLVVSPGALAELVDQLVEVATVRYTLLSTAPSGWLKANGAEVSRTTYAKLFAALSTTYGAGNGTTTFNLPDLRGEFIRGWDDGRGIDAGRLLGHAQGDLIKGHDHTGTTTQNGAHTHSTSTGLSWAMRNNPGLDSAYGGWGIGEGNMQSAGSHTHSFTTNLTGGAETRPRNIALLAIIKY